MNKPDDFAGVTNKEKRDQQNNRDQEMKYQSGNHSSDLIYAEVVGNPEMAGKNIKNKARFTTT